MDLQKRREASTRRANLVMAALVKHETAWPVILRSAGANPPRAIAPGQPASRLVICAVAPTTTGRSLLRDDSSLYSLVCYIENGDDSDLRHWCNERLAINAESQDMSPPPPPTPPKEQLLSAPSQAQAARALVHLIRPIGAEDVKLRIQCLSALKVQLVDVYARKECVHLPLLIQLQECVKFKDSETRMLCCDIFHILSDDKVFSRRLARKGYFNHVALMCVEIGHPKTDKYSRTVAEKVILTLLQREDGREAAVHGNVLVAFEVALSSGDVLLERWCVISLVELSKVILQKSKVIQRKKAVAIQARKKMLIKVTKKDKSAEEDQASNEAMVEAYVGLVLPLLMDFTVDDTVQAHAVEVMRYLCQAHTESFDRVGVKVFETILHLLESSSIHTQVECCRAVDVLVDNGHIAISTEEFTSLDVYSRQLANTGNFSYVDVGAMRAMPTAMQDWFGLRLRDDTVEVDSRGSQNLTSRQRELLENKKNPHQLLLAVAAPLLDSFATEARIAGLSLMRSLASKYPQFRIRMHLHDLLPIVMRIALASGNEMVFRNKAVSEERDLARSILCHLVADGVMRQALISGWKTTGILLVVKSYESVMMGIIDDDAGLRSHKAWIASALTEQAVNDPSSRQPIAKAALTVLLHFAASSEKAVRHAAVRSIATVLLEKKDRDAARDYFHTETVIKEMLRHLHIKDDDQLQWLIDTMTIGLLRDVEYASTKKPEETNTKSLLLFARSGTVSEKIWVGDTVVTLVEDHMQWSDSKTRLMLEALAALIQTNEQSLQVLAGKTLEVLVNDINKHGLLTNSGGILLLAGLAMSNNSSVQVSGLRALVALSASPGSQAAILDSGIPGLVASTLDVWYATIMTSGLNNVFGQILNQAAQPDSKPAPKESTSKPLAGTGEAKATSSAIGGALQALMPPKPAAGDAEAGGGADVEIVVDAKAKKSSISMFTRAKLGIFGVRQIANKIAPGKIEEIVDDVPQKKEEAESRQGEEAERPKSGSSDDPIPEDEATPAAGSLLSLMAKTDGNEEKKKSLLSLLAKQPSEGKLDEAQPAAEPEPESKGDATSAKPAASAILSQLAKRGEIVTKPSVKPVGKVSIAAAFTAAGAAAEATAAAGAAPVKVNKWKSAKKVAKKAVMISTLNKAAAGSRAKEQALVLGLSCTILEQLLSSKACNCHRDCIESGVLPSLTRTTLISWLHKNKDKFDHPARQTIASIKGVGWWNLGDIHNRGEVRQFPTPYPTIPEPMVMKLLAFGANHTLALSVCGAAFVTGDNAAGQLGLKKTRLSEFVRLDTLVAEDIMNVGCGATFSAAVSRDGRMWTWGCNTKGQCGLNFLSAKVEVPTLVEMSRKVVQATGGVTHGVLLDEKGQAWTWGEGAMGQLGHGDIRPRLQPTKVSAAHEMLYIACGPSYNVALTKEGKVVTWGDNTEGQLGFSQQHNGCMPAQVDLIADEMVTSIAVGRAHVVAVTVLGAAYSWGDNTDGQLGRKIAAGTDNFDHRPEPMFLPDLSQLRRADTGATLAEEPQDLGHKERIVVSACGEDHTVVVTSAGLAYVIGTGGCGQHGRLDTLGSHTPRLITTMLPTQHVVGAFCANSGTVLVSVPTTTGTSIMDPFSFAKATHDEYMTDLRVLAKILPGALFPRNRMERQIAGEIANLDSMVHKLVDMHEQLPEFPMKTKVDKPPPEPFKPPIWSEKTLFAMVVDMKLETEQSIAPFKHHLHSGKHKLQYYIDIYEEKIIDAVEKERQRKEQEELDRDGDPYENFVDTYAGYSEECLRLLEQAAVYLDNPTELPSSAHLWPTFEKYDAYALGLLAQDFVSDWARQGATERSLASEQISRTVAENLMGRELETLIATLPSCKPRPAALFFGSVERVLSQLGRSWHGESTKGQHTYGGELWRSRSPANIALLNLIALPMQRASLYFEMLRKAHQERTLRDNLKWTEAAPPVRRPAVCEVTLDMDFATLDGQFEEKLIADIAEGLDCQPRRFTVIRKVAGSVIVTMVLLPGRSKSEPAAEDLVDRFRSKSTDPNSILRRGSTTSSITAVRAIPIAEIPQDLLPDVIEVTKPYAKKGGSSPKSGFFKKKDKSAGNADEHQKKLEYAITKFASSQNIEHALDDLGVSADGPPSCCAKFAFVVGDTIGSRIVDIAAFDQIVTEIVLLHPPKQKPVRQRKRKKNVPKAHRWLVPLVFLTIFASLIAVLSSSDDQASGIRRLTAVLALSCTLFVAATLFRARAHSTLNLPAYKAGSAAAGLDLNFSNAMAAISLPIELMQHNVLALAVALNWDDAQTTSLDGWLFWAGRSDGIVTAVLFCLLAVVAWPVTLHAVLGRVTSRISSVEVVLCTVLPWLITEPFLIPIVLSIGSVIPCHEGWTAVECDDPLFVAVSSVSMVCGIVFFLSVTLTPVHLYYVRSDLQIRQQHWCRMVMLYCKCMLAALSVMMPASGASAGWCVAFSALGNLLLLYFSLCGGPKRTGSLVASAKFNMFRSFGFAMAAWSSCCLLLTGAGTGEGLSTEIVSPEPIPGTVSSVEAVPAVAAAAAATATATANTSAANTSVSSTFVAVVREALENMTNATTTTMTTTDDGSGSGSWPSADQSVAARADVPLPLTTPGGESADAVAATVADCPAGIQQCTADDTSMHRCSATVTFNCCCAGPDVASSDVAPMMTSAWEGVLIRASIGWAAIAIAMLCIRWYSLRRAKRATGTKYAVTPK
eukprot:SAG22_NODE_34_length_27479_cov_10.947480_2_plen_2705_part_00